MPRIFVQPIRVSDDDIDELGHVNNLRYLAWIQDVAIAHTAAQGWPLERYLALGKSWVVHSHFIKYVRPAFAGQEIRLLTWVQDFSPRHSLRKYLFLRHPDKKRLAEAATDWAFVNLANGRPTDAPPDLRDALVVVDRSEDVAAFVETL